MSLNKVFVAFDQMSSDEIESFLQNSPHPIPFVKIGLELFLKHGGEFVKYIHQKYHVSIFLDLKLHDIPVTVSKAIESLSGLPIAFLTIHLSGGREMIQMALEAQSKFLPQTKLLGVSFLTSLSNENIQEVFGIELDHKAFERMFHLARDTKIHGVVCSPQEVKMVKNISTHLICVTPGVRFQFEIEQNLNIGDQKRILSVEESMKNGSDFVVMGRSLTKEKDSEELKRKLSILNSISL